MISNTVLLEEMSREQIRQLAPDATVVLPTASTEQHGPHMPVMTDSLECSTICRRAAELAQTQIPIAIAPTLPFGYSRHHLPRPGVLSLSAATFLQVVLELGESLVASGFRRIAIVNGHGGNDDLIRIAANDIANSFPVSVAAASWWTIAHRDLVGEFGADKFNRIPGHAGKVETSLVLALRPELVGPRPELRGVGGGRMGPEQLHSPVIRLAGRQHGLFGPGYTDEPNAATQEDGCRYLDTIARSVAAFIVAFHRQHPGDTESSEHSKR